MYFDQLTTVSSSLLYPSLQRFHSMTCINNLPHLRNFWMKSSWTSSHTGRCLTCQYTSLSGETFWRADGNLLHPGRNRSTCGINQTINQHYIKAVVDMPFVDIYVDIRNILTYRHKSIHVDKSKHNNGLIALAKYGQLMQLWLQTEISYRPINPFFS